jgi:hypothetical protein
LKILHPKRDGLMLNAPVVLKGAKKGIAINDRSPRYVNQERCILHQRQPLLPDHASRLRSQRTAGDKKI